MKTWLIKYRVHGVQYCSEIRADTLEDAREHVAALARAKLDGELMAKIPVPRGPLERLAVWLGRRLGTVS